MVKNSLANVGDARDMYPIPGSGRSLGRGDGNSLQHSCLKNCMDRGSWQATVHRFSKSWTVHRERRERGYPGGSVVENWSARQQT